MSTEKSNVWDELQMIVNILEPSDAGAESVKSAISRGRELEKRVEELGSKLIKESIQFVNEWGELSADLRDRDFQLARQSEVIGVLRKSMECALEYLDSLGTECEACDLTTNSTCPECSMHRDFTNAIAAAEKMEKS